MMDTSALDLHDTFGLAENSEFSSSSDMMSTNISEHSIKVLTLDNNEEKASDKFTTHQQVPEHLESLLERASVNLTNEETSKLANLLWEDADIFSKHDLDIGHFAGVTHKIDTQGARPIKQRI